MVGGLTITTLLTAHYHSLTHSPDSPLVLPPSPTLLTPHPVGPPLSRSELMRNAKRLAKLDLKQGVTSTASAAATTTPATTATATATRSGQTSSSQQQQQQQHRPSTATATTTTARRPSSGIVRAIYSSSSASASASSSALSLRSQTQQQQPPPPRRENQRTALLKQELIRVKRQLEQARLVAATSAGASATAAGTTAEMQSSTSPSTNKENLPDASATGAGATAGTLATAPGKPATGTTIVRQTKPDFWLPSMPLVSGGGSGSGAHQQSATTTTTRTRSTMGQQPRKSKARILAELDDYHRDLQERDAGYRRTYQRIRREQAAHKQLAKEHREKMMRIALRGPGHRPSRGSTSATAMKKSTTTPGPSSSGPIAVAFATATNPATTNTAAGELRNSRESLVSFAATVATSPHASGDGGDGDNNTNNNTNTTTKKNPTRHLFYSDAERQQHQHEHNHPRQSIVSQVQSVRSALQQMVDKDSSADEPSYGFHGSYGSPRSTPRRAVSPVVMARSAVGGAGVGTGGTGTAGASTSRAPPMRFGVYQKDVHGGASTTTTAGGVALDALTKLDGILERLDTLDQSESTIRQRYQTAKAILVDERVQWWVAGAYSDGVGNGGGNDVDHVRNNLVPLAPLEPMRRRPAMFAPAFQYRHRKPLDDDRGDDGDDRGNDDDDRKLNRMAMAMDRNLDGSAIVAAGRRMVRDPLRYPAMLLTVSDTFRARSTLSNGNPNGNNADWGKDNDEEQPWRLMDRLAGELLAELVAEAADEYARGMDAVVDDLLRGEFA